MSIIDLILVALGIAFVCDSLDRIANAINNHGSTVAAAARGIK